MPDEITLRPVTADDLDLFEREFSGPEGWGPHAWFGFQSTADLRRRFAENGLLGPDGGLLSVAEGDVTVGRVRWFPGSWGPADLTNWSLAIGLVPSARGRGTGTRAQRLLAEYGAGRGARGAGHLGAGGGRIRAGGRADIRP
ncbi:GNAT family N-acetyltransferase [Streptomyces halstedii]|uniref:GNAT family N-acetyltransferase n=1 Tax=Streptomyces halstedii TaxID=1944 RepID=UPI00345FAC11